MYPFLKPGDRLVIKRLLPEDYQVGDIVIVRNIDNHLVVHRLIKLLPHKRGITKGDSLFAPDPEPIDLACLEGRVELAERKGRLISISFGLRSRVKGLYARLSRKGLTSGAIKLRIKKALASQAPSRKLKSNLNEKQMILSLLDRQRPHPTENHDWDELTCAFHREGMAGILYLSLKGNSITVSRFKGLENVYLTIAAQNIIHLQALEQLEEALAGAKIEIMTLKGAALLNHIYPKVGMRPMEDIDLMVRPAERERLVRLLKLMRYQQNPKRAYSFKKDKIILDIHTHPLNIDRIQSRAGLFPIGMEPIWKKSIPWVNGYRWIRRPNDADNIILLAQHFMKHFFSRLIWIEDINRLIQNRNHSFLIELANRADELMQNRPVAYSLYILQLFYNYRPPRGSELESLMDEMSIFERTLLNIYSHGSPSEFLAPLMALFCIQGFRNRLRFGLENLFPSKDVMRNEFGRVMGSSRMVFYPARLFQSAVYLAQIFSAISKSFIRQVQKRDF